MSSWSHIPITCVYSNNPLFVITGIAFDFIRIQRQVVLEFYKDTSDSNRLRHTLQAGDHHRSPFFGFLSYGTFSKRSSQFVPW